MTGLRRLDYGDLSMDWLSFCHSLPLIAMLTKEPEMLQPDAFCENTMQQNATAARAPQGSLQRSPSWRRGTEERRGAGRE